MTNTPMLDEWFGPREAAQRSAGMITAEGLGGIYSENGKSLRQHVGEQIANLMYAPHWDGWDGLGTRTRADCTRAATWPLEAAAGDIELCTAAYLIMTDDRRERQICALAKSAWVVARRMMAVVERLRAERKRQAARLCPECGSGLLVQEEAPGMLVCYNSAHEDGLAVEWAA